MGGFDHERWRLYSMVVLLFTFCRRDVMGYRGGSIRLDGASCEGGKCRGQLLHCSVIFADWMTSNGTMDRDDVSALSWTDVSKCKVWFGESERVED